MATTVKQLIEYLSKENPNAPVVYQYVLPEHTELTKKQFIIASEQLEDTRFFDEMSEAMTRALEEMTE